MLSVGAYLANKGIILRSGGAAGADTAFEQGCDKIDASLKEIYIPWNGFSNLHHNGENLFVTGDSEYSQKKASEIHPAWDRLSRGVKALHSRNVNQVMGISPGESELSKFVLFYAPTTKSDAVKGGTATAVNLALSLGIPVWNFYESVDREEFRNWILPLIQD